MTDQQKSNIIALRKKGLTYSRIAEEMGLSVNTVKSFGRRYDASKGLCRKCGVTLIQVPKQKPKTFCSDYCRKSWWKEHRDQIVHKTFIRLTCANCGQDFESYADANRKYCSHNCYIRHRYGVS